MEKTTAHEADEMSEKATSGQVPSAQPGMIDRT
jgi:hypothetical protein